MKFKRLVNYGIKYLLGHKIQGIGLMVTRRCNLKCTYCKIKDNSPNIKEKELTQGQWKRIIKKFMKNKHDHFIFTGGEPLLYDPIYELIDYTSKYALTSLITNATLLDKNNFHKLQNLDFLTFSCDTSIKNRFLCKESRDKFDLIMKYCKKYDIAPSVLITITSKNCHEIENIIKEVNQYGISILLSIIHSGKGDYDFRNYCPDLEFRSKDDFQNLEKLQEKLLSMKKQGFKIAENKEFIFNMINYIKGKYKINCPATNPFFTIDFDGKIKACHETIPSEINALEFHDFNKMKKEVKKTIPKNCNCFYDCYFNNQFGFLNMIKHIIKR